MRLVLSSLSMLALTGCAGGGFTQPVEKAISTTGTVAGTVAAAAPETSTGQVAAIVAAVAGGLLTIERLYAKATRKTDENGLPVVALSKTEKSPAV